METLATAESAVIEEITRLEIKNFARIAEQAREKFEQERSRINTPARTRINRRASETPHTHVGRTIKTHPRATIYSRSRGLSRCTSA